MSKTQQLLDVIAEDIRRDCDDYARLTELLNTLHGQLLAHAAEPVAAANAEVEALVEASRARAARRSKILDAFKLEQGEAGMTRLLGSFAEPRRGEVRAAWARLGELAAECKRLNDRNGQLLAVQQDILGQLMGVAQPEQTYERQPY